MRMISVSGTPDDFGLQHSRQIGDLRDRLVRTMGTRLKALRQVDADRPQVLRPVAQALEALDPWLMAFLKGLAAGLELDSHDLLCYTLSSYLKDLHAVSHAGTRDPVTADPPAGCTTWAATAPTTSHGRTLLVKNRDYHRDHIPLQLLVRAKPSAGYRYLSIGSAGSPEVFSSGINEKGLAVADTHVLSRDLGPGLPRYSLMRNLLTHQENVLAGLDYLASVQHMGGGTVILADAGGHLAVWESGYHRSGRIEAHRGFLVSTNHFVSPPLQRQWIEDEPPDLQGNSAARRRRVLTALEAADGKVDIAWSKEMMTTHGGVLDAMCRHPVPRDGLTIHPSRDSSTISAVILLPTGLPGEEAMGPGMLVAAGQPCQSEWERWHV